VSAAAARTDVGGSAAAAPFGDGVGEGGRCDARAAGPAGALAGGAEAVERAAVGDAGWIDGVCVAAGEGGGGQTSVTVTDGGRAWVDPVSPDPHTHPSRSPSATLAVAAPVEDHVQPPCPSPCQ